MKTLIAALLFIFSTQVFSYPKTLPDKRKCDCTTSLVEEFHDEAQSNFTHYQAQYNASIRLDNDAEFLEGTNSEEAVLMIHGFLASPMEVRSVAYKLNDMGYSVYMPLLYGFGADGNVANEGTAAIWRSQIKAAVQKLSRCYKRIVIGGMSLGGALSTDYVLNNNDPRISSVILMAPYYDVSPNIAKPIVPPIAELTQSIPLNMLFDLTHSKDLVEIMSRSRYYSDVMPLIALQELFKISSDLKNRTSLIKNSTPVFLAYSEADETINVQDAYQLPLRNFSNVKIFKMDKALGVPHQVTYETGNPLLKKMLDDIGRFVLINNIKHRANSDN